MDRRRAEVESRERVAYTCPPFEAAAEALRDALGDVIGAEDLHEALQAAQVAHNALRKVEEESERGRSVLREALVTSILETQEAREELNEAALEIASLKSEIEDLKDTVRELEAQNAV